MSKQDDRFLDIEDILKREVSYFGWYQIRVFGILCFTFSMAAFSTSEYVFTTGRIHTRCFIPGCESATDQGEFLPTWITNVLPSDGNGFDNCKRFANTTSLELTNTTCAATFFDQNTEINCESYVYENANTVVYDLGLACDEWSRSFIGSARMFGVMFSLPLFGAIGDRWGRRTAVTIAFFNTAWIGLLRYFVGTYIGLIFCVVAEASFGSGAIVVSAYILVSELVPAEHRIAIGAISSSFFALGQVILGLLAWALPYFRHLILVLYAPQLIAITYIWILPESVRWHLSKGQYAKATATLEMIAKVNGRKLAEKTLHEIKETENKNKNTENERQSKTNNEKDLWLVTLLFKHKLILLRCVVGSVWWITMTLIYYGLSINAVNITGNPYVNYAVVAVIEIPGFLAVFLLLQKIGRKIFLMASYWICAAGQIAYIFLPSDQYAASLIVYLISKFCIASAATTVYLYTMEIYPTQYRQRLFCFSSMMGRVGAIVAPLTPALGAMVWKQLPFVMFAGMALLSGLLVMLVPETRGCALPDTMQEASDMGKPVDRRPKTTMIQYERSISRL